MKFNSTIYLESLIFISFLHCLKQPTWSWRTKLRYKFHMVTTRITLDKGQGLCQRANSPSPDGFLSWKSGKYFPLLQHYRNPGNPQMNYTKVLRWMKTKQKKIVSNGTYICWKQFFSAFSSSFLKKVFHLFQNYLPMQSQGQSLKDPGGFQTTHCFSPTEMHQLPCPWMSWSGERWPLQQYMGPPPGPTWFSYANSSMLAQLYLRWSIEHIARHCAKYFNRWYLISHFEKALWVDIITLFYRTW